MCTAIPWFFCLSLARSVAHSFICSLPISFSYRCAMENALLLRYIRRHTCRNELLYACPMHSAESFLSMRYILSLVLVVVVSAMQHYCCAHCNEPNANNDKMAIKQGDDFHPCGNCLVYVWS